MQQLWAAESSEDPEHLTSSCWSKAKRKGSLFKTTGKAPAPLKARPQAKPKVPVLGQPRLQMGRAIHQWAGISPSPMTWAPALLASLRPESNGGPTWNGCRHHLSEPQPLPGPQVLTSHIEGGLAVQRVVFAKIVHGHGTASIDGEIHHLVKRDQLNGMELPIIDCLGTGRRWGAPPPREWASVWPISAWALPQKGHWYTAASRGITCLKEEGV